MPGRRIPNGAGSSPVALSGRVSAGCLISRLGPLTAAPGCSGGGFCFLPLVYRRLLGWRYRLHVAFDPAIWLSAGGARMGEDDRRAVSSGSRRLGLGFVSLDLPDVCAPEWVADGVAPGRLARRSDDSGVGVIPVGAVVRCGARPGIRRLDHLLFGVLLAIFWTGFLRVGSQVSLFLAPVAMALLLIAWFSDFDKVLQWT